jgi:DNA adenine methylase
LHQCAGYVAVSGYACPLYADLYESQGWQRHDKEAQTNSGGKRIESVWLSPRTVEALARPRQSSLLELTL